MSESPFRERPRVLLCPRCGEVLERVVDGIHTCVRCEGAWLENQTIDRAFGTQRWPGGSSAWWRRELECPACACEGVPDAMSPMLVGDMLVDRCANHGVWLDHGELGRLIGAPNVVELEELYQRLKPGRDLPAALLEQRERRAAERVRRQRELDDYRAKVAEERARIAAVAAAEHRRRIEELRAAERKRLGELRVKADQEAAVAERELVALREQVRSAEGKLADARSRLVEADRLLEALDAAVVT
jgi:Zn-finger nucleic acid-binding protein